MEEIDLVDFADYKVSFWFNPKLWQSFNPGVRENLSAAVWLESKFMDNAGRLHADMKVLPKNKGGIYLFVAKPNALPEPCFYLFYVGRALLTSKQNLRKRCSEYIRDTRIKINRMRGSWGKHLYVRYLPLCDNLIIQEAEKELINKLLPPFNDKIPDQQLQSKVKAF